MQSCLMVTVFAFCATALIGPAIAQGEPDRYSGTYEKKGSYWQQVVIARKAGRNSYVGSFKVSTSGCIGEAKMQGIRKGSNSLVFSKKDLSLRPKACVINVNFSSNLDAIKILHEYCFGYYGAACDFNGTLKRVSR